MKSFFLTWLAICATAVSADDKFTGDALVYFPCASSIQANIGYSGSVISAYHVSYKTTLPAAASTTLASLLDSLGTSWRANPTHTSFKDELSAVAPSDYFSSFLAGKILYEDVITQEWYTTGIDKGVQSAVTQYISAVESVENSVINNGGEARPTGLGVAGVLGVVGGVLGAML